MRGFIEENLKGNVESALEFYTSALEILRWGTELFQDVAESDRGVIFKSTFIRGVKCLRLNALMEVGLSSQ